MRILELDAAKAVGILLMIVGHCIYAMHQYPHVAGFIYTFHMPLFFVISGFFTKDTCDYNPWIKYGNAYIRPYIVASVLLLVLVSLFDFLSDLNFQAVYDCIIAIIFASGAPDDYAILGSVQSIGPLWFLFGLFSPQIIYFYINKLSNGLNSHILVLGSFAIGWLSAQYIRMPFSVQAGMCAVIFLHVGKMIRQYGIINKFYSLGILYWFIIILIYLIGWAKGKVSMSIALYELPFYGILGSIFATLTLIAALKKLKLGGGKIGKNTLYILCGNEMIQYFQIKYDLFFFLNGLPIIEVLFNLTITFLFAFLFYNIPLFKK